MDYLRLSRVTLGLVLYVLFYILCVEAKSSCYLGIQIREKRKERPCYSAVSYKANQLEQFWFKLLALDKKTDTTLLSEFVFQFTVFFLLCEPLH